MASKFSFRNSIFKPQADAMSVARSNSMPLLIESGSTSPALVPQKFGPGRLVTTDSTPALTGWQSLVPPAPPLVAAPPAAVVAAAAAVVPELSLSLLPHAARTVAATTTAERTTGWNVRRMAPPARCARGECRSGHPRTSSRVRQTARPSAAAPATNNGHAARPRDLQAPRRQGEPRRHRLRRLSHP